MSRPPRDPVAESHVRLHFHLPGRDRRVGHRALHPHGGEPRIGRWLDGDASLGHLHDVAQAQPQGFGQSLGLGAGLLRGVGQCLGAGGLIVAQAEVTPSRLLAPALRPASITGPAFARSSIRTVTELEAW